MTIKENYPKEAFKSNLNLISSHDVARIKTEFDEDIEKVKLAVSIQATFEGVPHIYYGDEAGVCGGVDPDNRRTYPWKNEDEDMIEFYKEAMNTRKKYDTLIHGDFCLPNILVKDNKITGFIDLGDSGIGDPWFDYAWCIWSLEYNLKTNKYTQVLLDKLGIEFDREKYLKYIS